MFDFVFRPLRSLLGETEKEVAQGAQVVETESHILGAVEAIRDASTSIERHVEVIEGLATSIDPLKDSVNSLTATMRDLVALMAPMGEAEHGLRRAEHFF